MSYTQHRETSVMRLLNVKVMGNSAQSRRTSQPLANYCLSPHQEQYRRVLSHSYTATQRPSLMTEITQVRDQQHPFLTLPESHVDLACFKWPLHSNAEHQERLYSLLNCLTSYKVFCIAQRNDITGPQALTEPNHCPVMLRDKMSNTYKL